MASLNETIWIMGAVKLNPRKGGYFCEFETKSTKQKKEAYLCFRQGRKRKIGKNKKKKAAEQLSRMGHTVTMFVQTEGGLFIDKPGLPEQKKKKKGHELNFVCERQISSRQGDVLKRLT